MARASVAPSIENSTYGAQGGSSTLPKVPQNFRTVMRKRFKSQGFQVLIVCLVIVDALLVLAELMLDLKIIQPDEKNYAARVLYCLSIAILTFFMIEIVLKLYVFHKAFFYHKFEILDVLTVIVSFALAITILFKEHDFEALGLLILLRLWRVARIMNSLILSVKKRSDRQLLKLKFINHQMAMKIQHLEYICTEKEQEIERLNKVLRDYGLLN
ncbi:voltage-gated hydrogen channel 1-like [Dromiciops gliroides]|uniref:voltage-gated hydrogen channel 1-like n=1 Tax=Dromiciops gliroides TaxID=33562 RepID=UPI001CC58B63|nr:voltage-gated hydrogen channel 1-like [Dromiciops gliroides]